MTIAIHDSKGSFSDRWIRYCKEKGVAYKTVDCYDNNIIAQVQDCDGLMWHFHHAKPEDWLIAKPLLYALAAKPGFRVFPDFNTAWHFDDKISQKYLLESVGAPLVPTHVFVNESDAREWAGSATYPVVFKLRAGAGSVNVSLVRSRSGAERTIRKAFGRGYRHDSLVPLREVLQKVREGRASKSALLGAVGHLFIPTGFSRVHGRERGYVYFQEFIPGNDHDIRVVVIDGKAFAIKRLVREGDFRASGSGHILYDRELFDEGTVALALETAEKMGSQCAAFDFVYKAGAPMIVEMSYGFSPDGYDRCPGYWDRSLRWLEGPFDPYGWMVEMVVGNSSG